ncbi:MAG TPA: hypothetical protein VH575_26110 [Gemmataceae bacterium]|jgi:hypothetical protein
MTKLYQYVGPVEIKKRVIHAPPGMRVESIADLEGWIRSTGQQPDLAGLLAVTFVIDHEDFLRVGDRRSEHVACSGGRPVLSAGEMFFHRGENGLEGAEVSNQSTDFCPDPESWPAVAAALDRLGIPHPGRFTQEIIFRRCPACSERNVVKDGSFTCGSCGTDLPAEWNFECLT